MSGPDRRRLLLAAGGSLVFAGAGLVPASAAGRDADLEGVRLLNRLTFGAVAGDLDRLRAVGAGAFVREQLEGPAPDLPPPVAARIEAMDIERLPLLELLLSLEAQNKAANALADADAKKAAQGAYQQRLNALGSEAAFRFILLALYGRDQLRSQMTWFWLNHFSVFSGKANLRAMVGDYEKTAVRPRALGRFKDLVMATLTHPAMLRYLDNADNGAGRLNENYARELMELHTLGVDAGYTQGDVQELARILTGAGIAGSQDPPKIRPELQPLLVRRGAFVFNPQRHDFGAKTLFSRAFRDGGFSEIERAVDLLVRHPATGRRIARKLAVFFVDDDPDPALVADLADVFTRSEGDIAAVLARLFSSDAFRRSLGGKFKDPVQFVLSAVRLSYPDQIITNPQPIQGWIQRLGEPLFGRETPDGYGLSASDWAGPGQLAARFEVARQIGSGPSGLFHGGPSGGPDTPAYPDARGALWYRCLRRDVGSGTAAALGRATSAEDWNVLYLSSPEFMRR